MVLITIGHVISPIKTINSLVVKDYVRKPNMFGWNIEFGDASIFGRVPAKLVINPFLLVEREIFTFAIT